MLAPRFSLILLLAALALAAPSGASHRQTAPVVTLTSSGDTPLSRQAVIGRGTMVLAIESGGTDKQIVTLSPFRPHLPPTLQTVIAGAGAHSNPAVSQSGRKIVFESSDDPVGLGLPGDQIVGADKAELFGASSDASGTSQNPSVDGRGRRIAFESLGDLAGLGSAGIRQVYLREQDGVIRQVSRGDGSSRNVTMSGRRNLVAFESTSDPLSGTDTGIAQIWVGDLTTGLVDAVTEGLGPSTNPWTSTEGRLVAFESTADLAGSQANTGTSRIYVYDTFSQTFARITNGPENCHVPSLHKVQSDWRIQYVCDGIPHFSMLRKDEHYEVPVPGGVTQRVLAMGTYFLVLSTTADLSDDSGTTAGNQIYLVNLYKRPAVPVPGATVWFPFQGVPPL